jgi:hypothetical protein
VPSLDSCSRGKKHVKKAHVKMLRSVAVVAATAALVLSGCTKTPAPASPKPAVSSAPADNGVAALSADEILERATQALVDVKSFRMAGTVVEGNEATKIDFKISGDDLLGTMTVAGGRVELLAVGGEKYLRVDDSLLALVVGESTVKKLGAELVATKWLRPAPGDVSTDDMFEGLNVGDVLTPTGMLTKGETLISNGRPVIELLDSESEGALHIATTGEPLPLKMGGNGADTVLFSQFGADFPEIKAPPAGEVVDLPQRKG